ncbi:prolipoprotein diacylglyceryl transferase [Candidatus Galacturonibacter soehngenii]|uniref:Phosphatidylglycerol--prolipoprotein diacylglyceryl transferase n=1 Tax=Candidatus Galacturonatibacter soehngenii TaxID=2307010 RepID=A0A7V7QP20_9FIRM|nr:prolipoprotein diacylglyceryl transferase [Candidatus Galacturonibacter soehngenii]KAB1440718.1 prolipoprotein diacylglyceryl transferase [Candidatus Galacturonibacter soehngenii]MBA4687478.1 prolipoprotein diacylglyceryl transferase [Candidatus Galacturonibacter soehngenii]
MEQYSISFPNLGIELNNVGKYITVFGFDVAYYGIIIGIGIMVGIIMTEKEAKRTNQRVEDYTDFALYAIAFSILGARIYYVAFSWDMYKGDILKIINIRQGGLAIYGGIIGAVITLSVFSKKRHLQFWKMADTSCIGLVSGQIIGRWGNFFNREAFGGYTNGLLAMRIPISDVRSGDITQELMVQVTNGINYIQVHPTFLYESLWNCGVLLLIMFYKKYKKFNGEVFLVYVAGYGLGRSWIEALRTDQLLIAKTTIPVSQLLSLIAVLASIFFIISKRRKVNNS